MVIRNRVLVRKPDINPDLLDELETTAIDRINLRLGVSEFPKELESIAVEVICALHNKSFHHGIKQENVDTFSVSFVDDILKEYETDFARYIAMKEKSANVNRGVLRFL
ncbi:phage head-tail connector protein [Neobacillus niacini]|uniref:phage head-tail connector protein n=1 Tax=Neobacillus niacini TaxID=86668 RepID=UPI003B011C9B